jgi:hypothetical protein
MKGGGIGGDGGGGKRGESGWIWLDSSRLSCLLPHGPLSWFWVWASAVFPFQFKVDSRYFIIQPESESSESEVVLNRVCLPYAIQCWWSVCICMIAWSWMGQSWFCRRNFLLKSKFFPACLLHSKISRPYWNSSGFGAECFIYLPWHGDPSSKHGFCPGCLNDWYRLNWSAGIYVISSFYEWLADLEFKSGLILLFRLYPISARGRAHRRMEIQAIAAIIWKARFRFFGQLGNALDQNDVTTSNLSFIQSTLKSNFIILCATGLFTYEREPVFPPIRLRSQFREDHRNVQWFHKSAWSLYLNAFSANRSSTVNASPSSDGSRRFPAPSTSLKLHHRWCWICWPRWLIFFTSFTPCSDPNRVLPESSCAFCSVSVEAGDVFYNSSRNGG